MDKTINFFNENTYRYDSWYDRHGEEFIDQLAFLSDHLPPSGGVEIGVGTGRFASLLGIKFGVDASENMLRLTASRGVYPILASAYELPFIKDQFSFSLFIFTLCFLSDPVSAIVEAGRISKNVISVILEDGTEYVQKLKQKREGFYSFATFYSTDEITQMYREAGLKVHYVGMKELITDGLNYRLVIVSGHSK
ncbi:MAG: class I SAM-dependent methyltransferase [Thermoplasmata archaeon]